MCELKCLQRLKYFFPLQFSLRLHAVEFEDVTSEVQDLSIAMEENQNLLVPIDEVIVVESSDEDEGGNVNAQVQVPIVNAQVQVPIVNAQQNLDEVSNSEDEALHEHIDLLNNIGTLRSPTFPEKSTVGSRLDSFYFWPKGMR